MASIKYRKEFKGKGWDSVAGTRGCALAPGLLGLRALTYCRITKKQLEAARVAAFRLIKGNGFMHQRVFPDVIVTSKPSDVRMGSGKGDPSDVIFRVKPGRILFEVSVSNKELAHSALALASGKLPCRTSIVEAQGMMVVNV